jgi:hypothetical protein
LSGRSGCRRRPRYATFAAIASVGRKGDTIGDGTLVADRTSALAADLLATRPAIFGGRVVVRFRDKVGRGVQTER